MNGEIKEAIDIIKRLSTQDFEKALDYLRGIESERDSMAGKDDVRKVFGSRINGKTAVIADGLKGYGVERRITMMSSDGLQSRKKAQKRQDKTRRRKQTYNCDAIS
jgi:hypothetical protein